MRPLNEVLFELLKRQGIDTVFGIPGDYILPLYRALDQTPGIDAVVSTHEPCAAFSADAYARMRGLSVLLVTYGVGGFNALNGVAGAYAENAAVVVISGGPPRGFDHRSHPLTPEHHHVVRSPHDQLEIYARVTDLAIRLESEETAAQELTRALNHARDHQRPVYVEIPTDMMQAAIPVKDELSAQRQTWTVPQEIVSAFAERIKAARHPIFMLGVETARFALHEEITRLMEATGIPAVTTVLGKGALNEALPGVLGVYAGVLSPTASVRVLVEQSDLVIMLGTKITDVNCGAFTADIKPDRLLIAKSDHVGDGHGSFGEAVHFPSFVRELADAFDPGASAPAWPRPLRFNYQHSDSVMDQYVGVIEQALTDQQVVIADTGDACYSSVFLKTLRRNGYLAPTFYNTMGYAVPAALGAFRADPQCRPMVLVGDGAFQMTGMEVSNLVRYCVPATIIIFNNGGFGMQRAFADGPFNDLQPWNYNALPKLFGGGTACRVLSPEGLRELLKASTSACGDGPMLVEAMVPKGDMSTGLNLISKSFSREKSGRCPLASTKEHQCNHKRRCKFCRAPIWNPMEPESRVSPSGVEG